MGDKKKHKEKQRKKSKKKQRRVKEKKKSRDDSSSQSDSSRSRSRQHKKSKSKKKQKKSLPSANVPTNDKDYFASVPVYNLPGLPITSRHMPPPVTQPPTSTPPVPKIKTKEVNIFKLFPKLPYGSTLFARTLYSSELISPSFHFNLLKNMCNNLQKTVRAENNKKATSIIIKCTNELQKIEGKNIQDGETKKINDLPMERQNRYQILKRVYEQSISGKKDDLKTK